jgi:hypothetical protein
MFTLIDLLYVHEYNKKVEGEFQRAMTVATIFSVHRYERAVGEKKHWYTTVMRVNG